MWFFFKVHAIPLSTENTPQETELSKEEELNADLAEVSTDTPETLAKDKGTTQQTVTTTEETLPEQSQSDEDDEQEPTTDEPTTESTEEPTPPGNSAYSNKSQHFMALVPALLIALSFKF